MRRKHHQEWPHQNWTLQSPGSRYIGQQIIIASNDNSLVLQENAKTIWISNCTSHLPL